MSEDGPEDPPDEGVDEASRGFRPHEFPPELYRDLRRLAASYLRKRPQATLQPTALVHEAFLKLAAGMPEGFRDRVHFVAAAANAMRWVLTDYARARKAEKRGAGVVPITLVDVLGIAADNALEILALDGALSRLAAHDPETARIVELRFFGGLTEEEVGAVLQRLRRTVQNRWAFARAWLKREMEAAAPLKNPPSV